MKIRKNSNWNILRKSLIVLCAIAVTLGMLIYLAFYDMGRLGKGTLISEVTCPNQTYTLKSYLVNGGATVSYCIRGELNYNEARKKPKNIYWAYREETAEVQWVDDNTVIINGIQLDVRKERYDWRRNN